MIEKAKKIAAGIIGYRMYTCREVYDKLLKKGIDSEVAQEVVGEFQSAGVLDDRTYALAYATDSVNLNGKGIYRIRQELYKKGIARSIIDEVCETLAENTFASLCEYVESRNLCDGINTRYDLEKLKARLARRGYSPSEIRECLRQYTFDFKEED